jgi:putative FmdB family regulatory protein
MPIYEFRCKKCNDQIEVYQKMSDKPPTRCRKCGGRMEKQFSRTSVQFKGDGWYVTDYARKGSVAETVDKELSAPAPEPATEKAKPKKDTTKDTTKKTGSNKSG